MKNISLIGSSGSIGTQVKSVATRYPDLFNIVAVCVHHDVESVYRDVEQFGVKYVGVSDQSAAARIDSTRLRGAQLFVGDSATVECARVAEANTVVVSVVGMVGLRAVMEAISCGKDVAVANKESLVTGGELVMRAAQSHQVRLTPIDSEHSAVWQALRAGRHCDVRRLILTASGGPFRGKKRADLAHVSVQDALRHPTWKMGAKITVDSATLMNKGLEIIEAHRLFSIDQIDVVVQPTSIVHSLVEYLDGSVLAQMSYPTMEIPIQLALTDPLRFPTTVPSLDLNRIGSIAFEPLDEDTFGCVGLARAALKAGGYAPTVLNAADEAAVSLFLDHKIGFLEIERIIKEALEAEIPSEALTVDRIYAVDAMIKDRILAKYKLSAKRI